ncbi:hypothetical protein APC39_15390 [Acinetobacter pittii]|uniref:hypothetical protein n=1 Tax=Acinetobacter pittii TaxID=48296 RepID=UPI0007084699|nr:hypothetical protein [Acinetobacter pittii]KQG36968.1 hypothetical protein APC39_15390 [Acinetobacter pittii]
MKNKECNSRDQFQNLNKKELIELLQDSHKRESKQYFHHQLVVMQRDMEIFELQLQVSEKNAEISILRKELKPNNFWQKMSIAFGFLFFLSVLILLSNLT